MAGESKIEWTDATWNPTRGCTCVSPGCKYCYAMKIAARFSGPGLAYQGLAKMHPKAGGQWTGKVRLVDDQLDAPLRWTKPRRIFVNSMSDLFHEALSPEQIAEVFAVMYLAPRHTFQVLTKRASRMRDVLNDPGFYRLVLRAAEPLRQRFKRINVGISDPTKFPAPWVRLGVSVENQPYADERLPALRATPAGTRFVSCEPLLEETDLRLEERSPWHDQVLGSWRKMDWPDWVPSALRSEIEQFWSFHGGPEGWLACQDGNGSGVPWLRRPAFGARGQYRVVGPGNTTVVGRYVHAWNNIGRVVTDDGRVEVVSGAECKLDIDWVIVGGESGRGARLFDIEWARSIIRQCRAAGVACFVKQLGAVPFQNGAGVGVSVEMELKSAKGGDMAEWPADLRVRQFPEVRRG